MSKPTVRGSIESQRKTIGASFDEEFDDQVSGSVPAAARPGFTKLFAFVRKGDVLHVYSVDRLGRDVLDVQSTVRFLTEKGVVVHVLGLGEIGRGVGELILAVLAQVADMERNRIAERTRHGREVAMASLAKTRLTHRGKKSLGRPSAADAKTVTKWRKDGKFSLAVTVRHFNLSVSTVKKYATILSVE